LSSVPKRRLTLFEKAEDYEAFEWVLAEAFVREPMVVGHGLRRAAAVVEDELQLLAAGRAEVLERVARLPGHEVPAGGDAHALVGHGLIHARIEKPVAWTSKASWIPIEA
jgi:hypothetical protein